jgi:putative ATP-dependent endonuclease of OLD family
VPASRDDRTICDEEEDEFEAKTYFAHSPDAEEGEEKKVVSRPIKREFGFLYLRARVPGRL